MLTNTPPFTATIVFDYDLTTNSTAPFAFLATNGLAVYAPPPFPSP